MYPIHSSRRSSPAPVARATRRRDPGRLPFGGSRQSRTPNPQPPTRGFTLVELLVVITIIAMLVAITSVAVMRGFDTAKQTRIKVEVDQLDTAFKAYKEKYGSYPPCDLTTPNNNPALRQHVARAFPRYDFTSLALDLAAAGVDTTNFRPDQALVFWLRGFSNDPLHPFVTLDDQKITTVGGVTTLGPNVQRTPLYDFDTTRLIARKTPSLPPAPPAVPSYFPAGVSVSSTTSALATSPFPDWSSGGAPYVYWDAGNYEFTAPMSGGAGTEAVPIVFNSTTVPSIEFYADAGVAAPYWLDTNENGMSGSTAAPSDFDTSNNPTEDWVNPESFQILATGGDGKYGGLAPAGDLCRTYPTGGGYDISSALADDDNVTNFCGQARLEAAKP